jgi:hypothetical protein
MVSGGDECIRISFEIEGAIKGGGMYPFRFMVNINLPSAISYCCACYVAKGEADDEPGN